MVTDLARFVGGAGYRLEALAGGYPGRISAGSRRASTTCALATITGGPGMFIELSEAQLALRDEFRAYFAGLISPAEREAMLTDRHGEAYQRLIRRMGSDGWLGVGWPTSTAAAGSARSSSRSSRARRPGPTSRCLR